MQPAGCLHRRCRHIQSLSVQAVLDTGLQCTAVREAIDAGLADGLVSSTDAITVMRDALDARKIRLSGGANDRRLNQQLFQPLLRGLTLLAWCQRRRARTPAQPDGERANHRSGLRRAVALWDRSTVRETHGREEQARVLAKLLALTVETARRILAVAPQSAQARSDTALDRRLIRGHRHRWLQVTASDAVNVAEHTSVRRMFMTSKTFTHYQPLEQQ